MSDSTKIVVERGDTDFEFRDDGLYLGETVVAYTDDYQYGTLIGGLEGGHIAWTVESLLASDVGQRNFGGVVREAVERGLIKRRPHSELPPYERTEKQ